MKTLEYNLTNFGSLFFSLAKNFELETKSCEHLSFSDKNIQLNFRRIWIESGLEAWCLTLNSDENINILHEKSNSSFFTVNLWNFNGKFSIWKHSSLPHPCQGIVYLRGDTTCRVEIKPNVPIKWITLVFSTRWFTTIASKYTNGEEILKMLESPFIIDNLSTSFLSEISEILNISEGADMTNEFVLKSKVYQLLYIYFSQFNQFTQGEISRATQQNNIDDMIDRIIQLIENNAHANLDCIFRDAFSKGISKNMLISTFKNRLGKNIYEYQKDIKWKRVILMLQEGKKVNEISKIMGYSSSTKLIIPFKKRFNLTPKQYMRIRC